MRLLYLKYKVELVLVVLPILILFILRWLGFDGMVGQDSYSYVDYGNNIKQALLTTTHPGDFRWPQGYPLLGALLSFTGLSVGFCLQIISCFSLSISLIFVHKVVKEIYPNVCQNTSLIYLVLFGVLAPYYIRNGMLTMSDIVACCLMVVAVFYGFRYTVKQRFYYLMYFSVAAAYGIFVRYPVALVLVPITIYILIKWGREIKKINHLLVLVVPVSVYFLHVYFEQNATGFLNHEAINNWSLSNYFSATFHTNQGTFHYLLPNLLYVFYPIAHYGFVLLGLLFVVFLIKDQQVKHPLLRIAILSYILYALFMAGVDTQNPRHLLIVHPLVLMVCFYGFNKVYQFPIIYKYRRVLLVLGVLFQVGVTTLAFKTIYVRNQLEQQITNSVEKYNGALLYGFDIDIALKSRNHQLRIINLWEEEYQQFEKGALVLFNEERFKVQWEGENPMLNWNHLQHNYQLIEIEQYPNNWKLYKIE